MKFVLNKSHTNIVFAGNLYDRAGSEVCAQVSKLLNELCVLTLLITR